MCRHRVAADGEEVVAHLLAPRVLFLHSTSGPSNLNTKSILEGFDNFWR